MTKRGIKNVPEFSMAEITGELVGKTWAEVGCIELLHRVYNIKMRLNIPTEYGDLNLENWRSRFEAEPEKISRRMVNILRMQGLPVEPNHLLWWDLVVCRQPDGGVFPGIYVGRGKVLTSTIKEGVVLAQIGKNNKLLFARGLLQWA